MSFQGGMPNEDDQLARVRALFIGDSGVGKTSLIMRISEAQFTPSFTSTIGVDYKLVVLDTDCDALPAKRVQMQLWDTAGQERFRHIAQSYYRMASVVIMVYDITQRETFNSIAHWVQEMKLYADPTSFHTSVLVATKCDATSRRSVAYDEGRLLAEELAMPFVELSSMSGLRVQELTQIISRRTSHFLALQLEEQRLAHTVAELRPMPPQSQPRPIAALSAAERGKIMRSLCKRGLSAELDTLLSLTSDVSDILDLTDSFGNTAVFLAAQYGREACMQSLIDKRADLSICNFRGRSPLDVCKDYKMKASIMASLSCKSSGLVMQACRDGDIDLLQSVLSQLPSGSGGIIDRADQTTGRSPIHFASRNGHVACLEALIQAKCRVNQITPWGLTAAHVAAKHGRIACLRVLAGCAEVSLEVKTWLGTSVIGCAKDEATESVIRELLLARSPAPAPAPSPSQQQPPNAANYVAQCKKENQEHDNYVDEATKKVCKSGSLEDVRGLMSKNQTQFKANLMRSVGRDGRTLVHLAAENSTCENAQELFADLEALGADLSQPDVMGVTPAQVALQSRNLPTLSVLLERQGGNSDGSAAKFKAGSMAVTLAHIACSMNYVLGLERVIAKSSCDVNRADALGSTPLHYASRLGHIEVARTLLEHGARTEPRDVFQQTAHQVARTDEMRDLILGSWGRDATSDAFLGAFAHSVSITRAKVVEMEAAELQALHEKLEQAKKEKLAARLAVEAEALAASHDAKMRRLDALLTWMRASLPDEMDDAKLIDTASAFYSDGYTSPEHIFQGLSSSFLSLQQFEALCQKGGLSTGHTSRIYPLLRTAPTQLSPRPPPVLTDCFLSHNWSADSMGRDNHARVVRVSEGLARRGVRCWLDAEHMHGGIRQSMTEGIESAKCFVCFLTKTYMEKVNQPDNRDACHYEFDHAFRFHGGVRMLPVVMERELLVSRTWQGSLAGALGGAMYYPMVLDTPDDFEAQVDALFAAIVKTVGTTRAAEETSAAAASV